MQPVFRSLTSLGMHEVEKGLRSQYSQVIALYDRPAHYLRDSWSSTLRAIVARNVKSVERLRAVRPPLSSTGLTLVRLGARACATRPVKQ